VFKNFKPGISIPASWKNRKALAAVCIAVSLLIGFVFMPLASNAAGSYVTVVRAKQNIPLGTQIAKDMVETVNVGKKGLPSGVLHSDGGAIGKYAAVGITAGDDITSVKLSSTGSMYNLSDGQLLISVAVKNFADSLSGKLQAGDIVSVFFPPVSGNTVTGGTEAEAQCPDELQYIKVVAVTNQNGGDTDETAVKKGASSGSGSNQLPAAVTLLVNRRQAQILAGQESNTVHLALACRGNEKTAKKLLTSQAEYFVTHSASSTPESSKASPVSGNSASSGQKNSYQRTSSDSLDESANLGAVQ
jgi:pilus assembly protein CpaB